MKATTVIINTVFNIFAIVIIIIAQGIRAMDDSIQTLKDEMNKLMSVYEYAKVITNTTTVILTIIHHFRISIRCLETTPWVALIITNICTITHHAMIHGLKDETNSEDSKTEIQTDNDANSPILPKSTFNKRSLQPEESIVNLETAVDLLGDLCQVDWLLYSQIFLFFSPKQLKHLIAKYLIPSCNKSKDLYWQCSEFEFKFETGRNSGGRS